MTVPEERDDPTNVKPIPIKVQDGRLPKEKEIAKESSKAKVAESNRKESGHKWSTSLLGTKSHPILKLNEYAKACSEGDSADDNCDFVKKVEYASDAISSASCVDVKQNYSKSKLARTTQIKRADAVQPNNSKEIKDKERKESKDHKEVQAKKESSPKKNDNDGLNLKKESGSKGKDSSGSKEKKHGSKTDIRSKSKDKKDKEDKNSKKKK